MNFKTMAIHKFDTNDFLTRIDETMLPILKRMNEKGFITTGSQAGRKSKGISFLNKELIKHLHKQDLIIKQLKNETRQPILAKNKTHSY